MDGIKRDLFPIVEEKPYFNTCSMGPLASSVKEAAQNYINHWNNLGGVAWTIDGGWNDQVQQARELFAELIGADPENIAYSFGNSVAISSLTSALKLGTNDEVIFNELDFPAIPTHLMAKEELDVKYRVVKSNDGLSIDVKDYRKYINDHTKLITACEVGSNTGFRINRDELIELAHENDIPVFLDTYQSTGNIPLDVKKTDVDFIASGCLKWLIGGFGISFLYVRDDWLEKLNPSSIGWMGVKEPFEDLFDKLRTRLHRPDDATKFQFGTPYPIGAMTATAGMKIIKEIGISKIYKYNMEITEKIIEEAKNRSFTIQTPEQPSLRGSIVNIKISNARNVVDKLQQQGFIVDMRSNGIRLAPHFYNNNEDVYQLFTAIDKILEAN